MSQQLDKLAIAALIAEERHWRDRADWDRMAAAYQPGCKVRLVWFQGTAADFLQASRAGGRGGVTKHRLGPSIVDVSGDRAVAETSTVVETRTDQDGIAVELFVYCRYLNRLSRDDDGAWRLASVDCICEKDTMRAVYPDDTLKLDRELLDTYRPSYRFLSYNMYSQGMTPPPDLPGDDRPDLCESIYAAARRWLRV